MEFDELLDAAVQARGPDELWDRATLYFASHAADAILYVQYVPRRPLSQDPRHLRSWGAGALSAERYESHALWQCDPIPYLSADWMSAAPSSGFGLTSARHSAFLGLLWPDHTGAAMIVPVFGPGLRHGFVAMDFKRACPPPVSCARQLQVGAQVLHQFYVRLLRARETDMPALSAREREVLGWLVHGKSNAEIATILGLSAHTVDTLMRRLYEKLDCNDRTTAAVMAVGHGLISADGPTSS